MAAWSEAARQLERPSEFHPELAREIDYVLEHLNDEHPDTVLLLASCAACAGLATAQLAHADRTGLHLRARAAGGAETELYIPFDRVPDSLPTLRAELLGLLQKARSVAGDDVPLTSLEQEIARNARRSTFVSSVERVTDLTPSLREMTVRGGLAGFTPLGPDQFMYVIVPRPSTDPSVIARGFRMEDLQQIAEPKRPAAAYYTVRRWVPEQESLDLWIVLHGHASGVSGWAREAKPGDRVALWGPRELFAPPPDTRSLLLVGDETALPAIAGILDKHGATMPAHVFIEATDAAHVVDLPKGPEVSITWLFREGDEPGTGTRLLDAVRRLRIDPSGLYAFGAAEVQQIGAIRRLLCRERALSREQVQMTGYWRRSSIAAS